ncbi:alanine racemase [Brevibacillus parabrevis]|uniref:alanine racemase n=1 Tax=Brevibacillus parabrevis TaxID=54914 RepID=UPI002E1C6E0D|nr:alanine racemase [Brevibacillus parabrevis]
MKLIGSSVDELDTPALLIDLNRLEKNVQEMQSLADSGGAALRPHIKTHKCAKIAQMQIDGGTQGITVAKLGEAEVMADYGLTDIFVATQIVGRKKLARLEALARRARIRLAVDSLVQLEQLSEYGGEARSVGIMIEVNTGLQRCGVEPDQVESLVEKIIRKFPETKIDGIFTREGQVYNAADRSELEKVARQAQETMVEIGRRIRSRWGFPCEVSVGCTLGLLGAGVVPGVTEIRPGTYVFYDRTHAAFFGDTERCAATILGTVISRPNDERAVADAGAKAMTIDLRASGLLATSGFGQVRGQQDVHIRKLSDEHAIMVPGTSFSIGQRIEIIPNHICPTVNLYQVAYGIRDGKVETVFPIHARGCNQ